jgi:hypothetical protein
VTGARNGDTAAGYQETRSRCRRGAGRPTRWRTPSLPPFSSHPRHHRPGPTPPTLHSPSTTSPPTPPTLHSPSTTSPPTRSATSTPLAVQLFSSTPRHPSPSPPTVWLPPPRQSMNYPVLAPTLHKTHPLTLLIVRLCESEQPYAFGRYTGFFSYMVFPWQGHRLTANESVHRGNEQRLQPPPLPTRECLLDLAETPSLHSITAYPHAIHQYVPPPPVLG